MLLKGKKIHFMGIGGIGVSALAEMALREGAVVSGCDRAASDLTRKLAAKGIRVFIGHDPDHVRDIDLLVHTSAIGEDHPERVAAGARQERRGQFLARFLDTTDAWGICGTHGKTTTSWLTGHLLLYAGRDPSIFIGGQAADLPEKNYRVGTGPFVSELDESDSTFLLPHLRTAVITNIESDHLSHYKDDAALFAAFCRYAEGVEPEGLLVAGIDNALAAKIFERHKGRKLSFGMAGEADVRAEILSASPAGTRFRLVHIDNDLGEFRLSLPGGHNVLNALAALACALDAGVDAETLRAALPLARGVERRLELLGMVEGASLYTDYAHHPTEVEASLAALRQLHAGPVLLVFQPHLFTRTRDYADAFAAALAKADTALVTDIYPARENPIPGVTAELLVQKAGVTGTVRGPIALEKVEQYVLEHAGKYDAVVLMGAGSVDSVARRLAKYT